MKVLMTTMQLDIGGAETHIVELSKALARRGTEVMVASNGGAYVKELEDAGIRHFKVELNRKSPLSLFRSYKALKEIILKTKPDVVHAHARIPGFLCGILHKRLNFRFVTTAHWVFTTRFPFNLLTNWGERSLAVSDDIKTYLTENYGVCPEDIRVTINGVDTDKFSDNIDYSDVAQEFGMECGKTRIVYVSRMDIDRSLAAHKLIEAVPELFEKIPDLEVVIVGGGNDFEPVKNEAESVNIRLGKRVIITTGSRTDINKFAASGDVFVGVSRAALEAMASKKPAIIAGNEGYIGIFDESKLQVSIDTNFCCRGLLETTTEKLRDDILKILGDGKEDYRKVLGEYSLETVKKYYSVDTMADDALKMYVSAINNTLINETLISEESGKRDYSLEKPLNIAISGYYGFQNSGDDSILTAMVKDLKSACPRASITVLSKNPQETLRIYGVNAINRFNFFKIYRLFKRTNLLLSGGGSLIQDVTSSKSLYYYLSIILMAKLCGAKVMLYANGIGPVTKAKNLKYVRAAFEKADYITLRENDSLDELLRIAPQYDRYKVTADPVFTALAAEGVAVDNALTDAGLNKDDKFFVVSVRSWKALDKDFENKICEFSERVYSLYKIKPLIVPMQKTFDKDISERMASLMTVPFGLSSGGYPLDLMIGIIKRAEFVLGMRLHSLIYAAKAGVPSIALDYDPKVSAAMKSFGLNFFQNVENIDAQKLLDFAEEILENRNELCDRLSEKSKELQTLAMENTKIAIELLNS